MSSSVNLRDLAIERSSSGSMLKKPRRRAWLSRFVVPGIIFIGFFGLIGWAMRDQLVARRQVSIVPVIVARAEVQQAGTPLFQAAGWIEPRPTPVNAAAFTEGVVGELLVVEGQSVQKDQPVANLVDVDARLVLKDAEATLALRNAELQNVEAELKAARLRVQFPVHLEAQLADAESAFAGIQTELKKLPFLMEAAEAQLQYARHNLEGKRSAGAGVSGRSLQLAESEFASAKATLNELEQRQPSLIRERDAFQKKVDALQQQLKLLIEEYREVETATARRQAAEAIRDRAQLAVETARLSLDRCVVRSPINGRVMQLVAHPGTRVMGLESTATRSSSTVVSLYDPTMLQVRADVRLEDVPLVESGQSVEVTTASSKELIQGIVLRSTSTANVQKNTLEVKVALTDPPQTIRPEMLVTATFLAAAVPESQTVSRKQQRLMIPRKFVEADASAGTVWIVDANHRARAKAIQLGKAGTEELIEVVSGLTPTDKLISSETTELTDGESVTVIPEK